MASELAMSQTEDRHQHRSGKAVCLEGREWAENRTRKTMACAHDCDCRGCRGCSSGESGHALGRQSHTRGGRSIGCDTGVGHIAKANCSRAGDHSSRKCAAVHSTSPIYLTDELGT